MAVKARVEDMVGTPTTAWSLEANIQRTRAAKLGPFLKTWLQVGYSSSIGGHCLEFDKQAEDYASPDGRGHI